MNTFMSFRLLIVVATVILTGSSTFALEASSIILSEVSLEQFQKKVSKKDVELQKLLKEILTCEGSNTTGICCSRVYTDKSKDIWLVERCHQGAGDSPPGIYILRVDLSHEFYNWFDEGFTDWECSKKYCTQAPPNYECSWTVTHNIT